VFFAGWNRDNFYCAVKFGPHGGGHGHFDKGEIYLQLSATPGDRPGLRSVRTAKHSTVVVDRMDQRPASGRLIDWHQGRLDLISIEHQAYAFVTIGGRFLPARQIHSFGGRADPARSPVAHLRLAAPA